MQNAPNNAYLLLVNLVIQDCSFAESIFYFIFLIHESIFN